MEPAEIRPGFTPTVQPQRPVPVSPLKEAGADGAVTPTEDQFQPLLQAQALLEQMLRKPSVAAADSTPLPLKVAALPSSGYNVSPQGNAEVPLQMLAGLLSQVADKMAAQSRQLAHVNQQVAANRQEVSDMREQRDSLLGIGQSLSLSTDRHTLLSNVLEHARGLVGANKGSLYLFDDKTQDLGMEVFQGVPLIGGKDATVSQVMDDIAKGKQKPPQRFKPGEGVAGKVFAEKKAMIVDAPRDPRFQNLAASYTSNLMCIPLVTPDGKCVGVINMTNKKGGQQFTEDDVKLMAGATGPAALAILNAEKEHKLAHDELTGVASRSRMAQFLQEQMPSETGKPLSVLMIDCDDFSRFNNTDKSHATGNAVLIEVARRMQEAVGESGMVARMHGAGDEFAIVLPDMEHGQAEMIKRMVQNNVANRPISHQGRDHQVILSVGVASAGVADTKKPSDLLGEADHAMYEEKQRHYQTTPKVAKHQPIEADGYILS